jgi:phospholipase C
VQKGELVVSHVDCNTVPFLWNYADRFTIFDNFFDTVIGPSTPNALAMFSGQSGVTQWIKYPQLGLNVNNTGAALPVVGDPQPFWGSALDPTQTNRQPTEGGGAPSTNPASNQTYASLGLSFMGNQIQSITANDLNPAFDLIDVQQDIKKIAGSAYGPVPWGWYEEGYDHEPTDPVGVTTNLTYIAHHDAPQYFGYEANNPVETQAHMKGLGDFFTALNATALPGTGTGGVYYVRGGYGNLDGLIPRSPSPAVEAAFAGNDDHPGYSDAQISEALLGDTINAIANSPYWPQSAIIITYDETDGLYDHTQPAIRSWDPNGAALDQGPRIPTIVISPYGVVHGISHEATEHSSIIKFIDELFKLTPLANLPDEAAMRKLGKKTYGQKYLGPSDAGTPGVGDLFTAFDNGRLTGQAPPLPAQYATIPQSEFSLPHFGGQGCRVLGIVPTDVIKGGVIDPAPQDVNPRPSTNPGEPYLGGWPTN